MTDNEMIPMEPQNNGMMIPEQFIRFMEQQNKSILVMAEAIKATNESVEMLKRQMQQLVPITASQASAINRQIRLRATDLRAQYRLPDTADVAIAAAIRKDVKLSAGARSIGELPRSMYSVYAEQVALWDNYAEMKAIKARFKDKG